jgi:hypothetical protein
VTPPPDGEPRPAQGSLDPAADSGARPARPAPGGDGVLPDIPDEETGIGWGEQPDRSEDDRLWSERPPHHLP